MTLIKKKLSSLKGMEATAISQKQLHNRTRGYNLQIGLHLFVMHLLPMHLHFDKNIFEVKQIKTNLSFKNLHFKHFK
jgi:hypothetical protein